jgi:DNA-nicking Smr family endonuclease
MRWPFRKGRKSPRGEMDNEPAESRDEDISEATLASGVFHVSDTLDLHGFFPQQIPPMIRDFIDNAQKLGLRRLRIVHGKGKSRLKWEVHQVLKESPGVESFGDAPPEAGGWGATIITLKQRGEQT